MRALSLLAVLLLLSAPATGQQLTDAEQEDFLRNAEIVLLKPISIGITNSRRATCSRDGFEHQAHVQTIDRFETVHQTARGTEVNFRDFHGFNVAAYRLDRVLGLRMVPVSVRRKVRGDHAAVTWWIDDFLMLEKDRWRKDVKPPDISGWNQQMRRARVFNELIYNTDANLGNVVIDGDWRIWLIDFTRAFRTHRTLRAVKNITRIDRGLLERLRAVADEEIERAMNGLLRKGELRGLLARRRLIVDHFDRLIATNGEAAVVYDAK